MEQLLHYVWKHKVFPLSALCTTDGEVVEVIDVGLQNQNSGPDFFNAKIKIGGNHWVGNVEIHTQSSHWTRHGHHNDEAYNNVILHVAEEVDCEVFRSNGEKIPQLQLSCPEVVKQRYHQLRHADTFPPCYSTIGSLPKFTVHSWLSALQVERFQQKAQAIVHRLKRHDNNWEDVFFITLSRNFGFGVNGDAFEAWAGCLPFRAIDKHRDNLFQVEAFFFGVAGLLSNHPDDADDYYEKLQKEFAYLQHKFQLPYHCCSPQWRFLRMRPSNFPHVRLAQLAHIYHKERSLFSRIIEAESVEAVCKILTASTSPYWKDHYCFGTSSPEREKQMGRSALHLIIINTIVPFLYAYGLHRADELLCERATKLLDSLKAEDNYVIRQWSAVGIKASTAADSQALLQLKREYCDKKECLRCRFGFEYLRKKEE